MFSSSMVVRTVVMALPGRRFGRHTARSAVIATLAFGTVGVGQASAVTGPSGPSTAGCNAAARTASLTWNAWKYGPIQNGYAQTIAYKAWFYDYYRGTWTGFPSYDGWYQRAVGVNGSPTWDPASFTLPRAGYYFVYTQYRWALAGQQYGAVTTHLAANIAWNDFAPGGSTYTCELHPRLVTVG